MMSEVMSGIKYPESTRLTFFVPVMLISCRTDSDAIVYDYILSYYTTPIIPHQTIGGVRQN